MKTKLLILLSAILTIAACASNTTVHTGVNTVGKMRISTEAEWRSVSDADTPAGNGLTRTWTKSGLPQDRLILIAGIKEGNSIFKSGGDAFLSGMSGRELEQIVQSSIPVATGASAASIRIRESGEQSFGLNEGVFLEFSSDTGQQGIAGAFVFEDALYVNMFLAADADTFSSIGPEAEDVILSATGNIKTIRRY